jgi:8-oxo-dGTP pyrophosphatase MutT (NUDIX family)
MEYETRKRRIICSNCGKQGHELRMCNDPITSYGIININILDSGNENMVIKDNFSTSQSTFYKIISQKYPEISCYISDNIKLTEDKNIYKLDNDTIPYEDINHIRKFCYYKDKIQFMMVSRRFSIGFIEFIRGRYDINDTCSIINLFEQMYDSEIKLIKKNQFDNLLYLFLNRKNESKEIVLNRVYEGKYSNEYCESKVKFNLLSCQQNVDDSCFVKKIPLSLDFYINSVKPKWKKPEWGFPKGRREKRTEESILCACREFEEETGYQKKEYHVLNKIEEKMTGTNGVSYRHVYYLSINNCIDMLADREFDHYEIGEIKWFTYDEAMSNIRPYHIEKKKILTRVYLFILNYLIHNNILD